MRDVPDLSFETIKRMEDMTWFTHAQIFDDLLIVSQRETSCYILKTSEGLVVIDGIWPDERVLEEIKSAITDAKWDNERISRFFITHGHIDHVGCGKWLVDNYNVKTYLSEADDELRRAAQHEEGRSDCWKEFDIDFFLHDGDRIDCGDKSILALFTPGHTKGCMSFIFPVYDKGEKHMACIFGGATPPWGDDEGNEIQMQSVTKFLDAAKENGCDVALTNHTAFDCGLERIAYSRARLSNLPNIYVIGEDGVQKFCDVFRRVCKQQV